MYKIYNKIAVCTCEDHFSELWRNLISGNCRNLSAEWKTTKVLLHAEGRDRFILNFKTLTGNLALLYYFPHIYKLSSDERKVSKVRESTKNNLVPSRQITLRLTVSKLSENFAHNNFGKNMNAAIKMIHLNDVRIFKDVAN